MLTSPLVRRLPSASFTLLVALAFTVSSCSGGDADEEDEQPTLGRATQALDTDADGLDDAWETTHFGSLSQTAAGDFDSDGMTNLEEYTHGFVPTVADAFDDADGDRYPNIFEIRRSSDPNVSSSTPTANFVVDGTGGGTHTTFSAAVNAANVANGAYQIIAVAPGTYSAANLSLASNKPKFLVIGLQGADETIVEGGSQWGWNVSNAAVIASLTFRKMTTALYVHAAGAEIRFVDLIVRDNNGGSAYAGGVYVASAAKVHVVGSTFLDNAGLTSGQQIYFGAGAGRVENTVLWSQATGTMLGKATSATLTTNYTLAKGQTLTGTGNLSGSTDPKLRSDGHLLWDSPLRAAGGALTQSRIDLDGELRPTSSPDIGVDQFVDSDADDLADSWEVASAGNLTTLTSRSQDADSDGATNDQEYGALANPTASDTDGDGLSDGDELNTHGTSPISTDSDGDDMPDGWEVTYGLSPAVANGFEDADGDRYPNVFEYARGTDPNSAASIPTANFVVDGTGGGTHTTISAAVDASNVANGAYQIVAIAPGVHSAAYQVLASNKPKLLVIGLQGAEKTVIDGNNNQTGWQVQNTAVIASLTFRRMGSALYVNAPGAEARFVDLIVRDNAYASFAAGVHVASAAKVHVVGSTFIDNAGMSSAQQIYFGSGVGRVENTVIWGQATGTMLGKATAATLTTNYSLAKGQTLTGTGNLSGSTDPKLRATGHLLWDSPLRGVGGSLAQSRIDVDGELRPSAPDIGVDQFLDSDSDDLADSWESAHAGNLTTLTSRTQDADSDGATNEAEYVARANPVVSDTDGDGLSDGAELGTHGTSPISTDTDGDDMPDGWETTHGLSPLAANAFEDADGDRYPNVFEYARGTDPSDAQSTPTANFTVDGTGGGTHTTMSAAVSAANVASGAYQIIAVAPGTYSDTGTLSLASSKPKFLVIGLQGAEKTIIDGGTYGQWNVHNAAVIASLTFKRMTTALSVNAPGKDVRFVDLIVRDSASPPGYYGPSVASGVHVASAATAHVVGSTFLDNTGLMYGEQIYFAVGAGRVENTVIWSRQESGTMLGKGTSATLTTNHSLAKGQTLTGTGNLSGSTDPKLRPDGRPYVNSPLRGAGGTVAQSRIDLDGELRPTSAPDIGVDQFVDSDSDGVPDSWEMAEAGNLTTLPGSLDDDGDGLMSAVEEWLGTDPFEPDSDNDGFDDGLEVSLGMNPSLVDSDDVAADHNQDGIIDGIGVQLGYTPGQLDDDGDSVSNADEVLMCLDPFRADSDGDGVSDDADAFPLDPRMSALPSNPLDATPPVITLTAPWYAVEL
jgi:hypothetical protein